VALVLERDPHLADAVAVSPADLRLARDWAAEHFGCSAAARLPFSFRVGGSSSRELLPRWRCSDTVVGPTPRGAALDNATVRSLVFTDPDSGLVKQRAVKSCSCAPVYFIFSFVILHAK
jgi:hypothetical protein